MSNEDKFSPLFLVLAVLMCVCLIASNIFEIKVFSVWDIPLTGGLLVFPISYILNDCLVEVWGFKKANFVIRLAFSMDFFFILIAQLIRLLPGADFWAGAVHFDYVFSVAPRMVVASLAAFLVGSTVNAVVMSKMKVASEGRRFGLRAIVSSLAGETVDSLVFFPIAFWGMETDNLLKIMLIQVVLKTLYEFVMLPFTYRFVNKVKQKEKTDVFDTSVSYNPFK